MTVIKRAADNGFGIVIGLAIAVTGTFLIVPLVVSTLMSFDAREYLGPFPPSELSLHWYVGFFSDAYYLRGLRTSLLLAVIAAISSTTIGVGTALVLDHYDFRGKQALSAFFLSPLVVPHVIIGFALLMFFANLGIFDGLSRLIAGHVIITVPYAIRTTLASLVGIRKNMTEAAMSLGATESRAFWKITFPLSKTGILAGLVFAFAFSMDDVSTSLFLTDPETYTLPVAMINKMKSSFDLAIAAGSVLLITMTVILIFILDRVAGLDRIVGQGVYRS